MKENKMTINTTLSRQPPDILRWLPSRWELFVGNGRLKRHLMKLVRRIRKQFRETGTIPDVTRLCFLITGVSRSGKTAIIKHLVRCLSCQELDEKIPESVKPHVQDEQPAG
jgi:hypothetical protein